MREAYRKLGVILLMTLWLGALTPVLIAQRHLSDQDQCAARMRTLSTAMLMYLQDYVRRGVSVGVRTRHDGQLVVDLCAPCALRLEAACPQPRGSLCFDVGERDSAVSVFSWRRSAL
jgi:hypothetical protein